MEFVYYRPNSIQQLVDTLSALPNYALLAGGTDLLVKMKEKLLRPMPQAIVDINEMPVLCEITEMNGYLWIGALVTHTALTKAADIHATIGILAEAAGQVGSPQIRNRGTLGGNICNASPAADTVPALLALDSSVEIWGQGGQEEIPLANLLKSPGKTCLLPGQFITRVKVRQIQKNEGAAFLKFGKRKALAIAIINGAIWLKIDGNLIRDVRIAFGSVAPTAIRLPELEKWLIGKAANDETFAEAGRLASRMITPIDDVRCKASYRVELARIIVSRGLAIALERAQEGCRCE